MMMAHDRTRQPFRTPAVDLAELTNQLGQAWAVTGSEPLAQYLAWSEAAGIFSLLASRDSATLDEIITNGPLNRSAADALVCILASLRLVERRNGGGINLTLLGREYLTPASPFYVGDGLYLKCRKDLPQEYLRTSGIEGLVGAPSGMKLPVSQRLRVQHSRNFAPSVVAARSGRFEGIEHVVDIAGGSGVLAIPLALDRPKMRITLAELPEAIADTREMLATYGVEHRIELVALDVFRDDWCFGMCDGIFFGNFFHFNDDAACRFLARKSFESLSPNGRIWLHEVLFNENRDGPLLAALWNILMFVRKPGARQRTASELFAFLREAGFQRCESLTTAGDFTLLEASRI